MSKIVKNLTCYSSWYLMHLMRNELLTQRRETEVIDTRTPVLVSGLPGKMATLVAEALAGDKHYNLLPVAMTSARHKWTSQVLDGSHRINLVDYCPFDIKRGTIAVDYTTPRSAETNAISYTHLRVPFVMGTTGGNRLAIENMVRNSEISAVIAPNMAAAVVEVQDELARLIETSSNHFQGWHMTIRESHQAAKRDVSGTAKAFQAQLEGLGAVMDGEIESVREPERQRQLGIQSLDGHAYHWITLTSSTGETREFRTAIEGRQPYVDGTLMAVRFLARRMNDGSRGEVFTMSDVVEDLRRVA